jgi:DNA polymerase II large subunit
MPIGLTASGEIVFPIQCKALIEQHRGKDVNPSPAAVEQKPAAVEQKPATVEQKPAAVEEKAAAKQSETVAPENSQSANKPAETAALQKRVEQEPRERACQHFRSYDAASGTYTGFDGQRHPCR